jgi:hypothetical protein
MTSKSVSATDWVRFGWRNANPIVGFNTHYYKYPATLPTGYWGRYPVERGLTNIERGRRELWIDRLHKQRKSPHHREVLSQYCEPSDEELFAHSLAVHGLYAERFFAREMRPRIAARLTPSLLQNAALLGLLFTGGRVPPPPRSSKETRRLTDLVLLSIISYVYEELLLRAVEMPSEYRRMQEWYDAQCAMRSCAICGNSFKVIDIPYWVYFGSNGCKECCFQCPMASPGKFSLLRLLPSFVEACGFVPASDVHPVNFSFTSRLQPGARHKALALYAETGGMDHIRRQCGSWFRALAESGLLPGGVQATSRGIRCLARDGHECRSLDEQRIDNWLADHGFDHEREPFYPVHAIYNASGRRRADWRVADVFIEYFGLHGDEEYDRRCSEKIIMARSQGIKLVAVYPYQVEELDSALRPSLTKSGSQA